MSHVDVVIIADVQKMYAKILTEEYNNRTTSVYTILDNDNNFNNDILFLNTVLHIIKYYQLCFVLSR